MNWRTILLTLPLTILNMMLICAALWLVSLTVAAIQFIAVRLLCRVKR